jgi:hypothetical protein
MFTATFTSVEVFEIDLRAVKKTHALQFQTFATHGDLRFSVCTPYLTIKSQINEKIL